MKHFIGVHKRAQLFSAEMSIVPRLCCALTSVTQRRMYSEVDRTARRRRLRSSRGILPTQSTNFGYLMRALGVEVEHEVLSWLIVLLQR